MTTYLHGFGLQEKLQEAENIYFLLIWPKKKKKKEATQGALGIWGRHRGMKGNNEISLLEMTTRNSLPLKLSNCPRDKMAEGAEIK